MIRFSERKPTNARYDLRDDLPVNYEPGKEYPYAIAVMKGDYIIDVRIVRTQRTLNKISQLYFGKYNLDILVYPQPVKPSFEFFNEYKQARKTKDRIALFKKYNILHEENILFINKIILDIDSPFEAVEPIFKQLKINSDAIDIIKTKRGRFRCAIHVKPTPKRHLDKAKEMIEILNDYFIKHNLNADNTFKNIQHPVWLKKHKKDGEAEEEIVNHASDEIGFFDLYRIAKDIQKEHKLYKEDKNKPKPKKKERVRRRKRTRNLKSYINAPSFIEVKNIDVIGVLEKAVDTLWHNKKSGTYINFIQVVAGWVKSLGFDESLYWELMNKYIPERKKDIKTGWKYARPLEFNYKITEQRYNLKELTRDALDYIKICGEVARQELLRKVFNNQKWLEQKVMSYLVAKGKVEETFKKQDGKGRPSKIYTLKKKDDKKEDTKPQEQKKTRKLPRKTLLSAVFSKSGNEKYNEKNFSHIITLPSGEGREGNTFTLGSGGGWYNRIIHFYKKNTLIHNNKNELLNRGVFKINIYIFKHIHYIKHRNIDKRVCFDLKGYSGLKVGMYLFRFLSLSKPCLSRQFLSGFSGFRLDDRVKYRFRVFSSANPRPVKHFWGGFSRVRDFGDGFELTPAPTPTMTPTPTITPTPTQQEQTPQTPTITTPTPQEQTYATPTTPTRQALIEYLRELKENYADDEVVLEIEEMNMSFNSISQIEKSLDKLTDTQITFILNELKRYY